MKNQNCHLILYILLQVLGILVDGVLGIGYEMMAVLIFSIGKNRKMESLFRQGIFIIGVEILIDVLCGDAEMIFETGFWFLEEMRRAVLSWSCGMSLIFIFVFYFSQKETTLGTLQDLICKSFSKLKEISILTRFQFYFCSFYKSAVPIKNVKGYSLTEI